MRARLREPEGLTRILAFHPEDGGAPRRVTVTIAIPQKDPGGRDWQTTVTLEGAGLRKKHLIHGVDAVQCIVEALFLLPTLLLSFPAPGRLTFLGGDDLRFVHTPPQL